MSQKTLNVECPYCGGDGCDPHDTGTAVVADCPACNGSAVVSKAVAELTSKGMQERWTWEAFRSALMRLESR